MKAVVMAGGFGTRIAPLTNSTPKPMLPAVNRPMMEYAITQLRDIGIREFVVLLYFKPEVIKNYFGSGSKLGIKIDYILPDDDYGTAGAVKKAEAALNEPFIIASGDLVTDFDFKKIVAFHENKRSKLTITLTSVADPLQFGVVIADKKGQIKRFLEKPGWGELFSDTINTGIYVLEPEILSYIPENTNYDFSKDLFPKLMNEGITLWGCDAQGYWRDVGNPSSYREAMEDILNKRVSIPIAGKRVKIGDGVAFVGEGTELPKGVGVEGVAAIGDNVKIAKDAVLRNVIIGDNCAIGSKTLLEDCTLWSGVKIGEGCRLKNSVFCNNVTIGDKTVANYGAIIAEECEIGSNVHIEKDVIVWPKKAVEDGAIVSSNIIWGDKYKKALFEGGQVKGRTNIELSCEMATKLASAFASTLPVHSRVYISRDYHRASRMLKRAFMSGMMSAGVSVLNPHFVPSAVLRYSLSRHSDVIAGVHFRQSENYGQQTEILFYDESGLPINTNVEKNVERIFFRENFRRVGNDELGAIYEAQAMNGEYLAAFAETIDTEAIGAAKPKIAVDLLFGNTSMVYPAALNNLGLENIMLDAYFDDRKLSRLSTYVDSARFNISQIVKNLKMTAGFLIYPHGQRLEIFTDEGKILEGHEALLILLQLLNAVSKPDEKLKVYLPVFAPDVLDSKLTNLTIARGKMHNLSSETLRGYDVIATLDCEFAFSKFGLSFDAMYSSAKMVELLAKTGETLSNLAVQNGRYHFAHQQIPCDISLKGTMMRKFSEEAMGKEVSFADGVKIVSEDGFVVMIPDQYEDAIHLYIEAKNEDSGNKTLTEYAAKISKWKQGEQS
ncbi:MAG: NTP transferase domain-containing protein [Helicobacteraceae bacterium]|jgi:mannose-1-phosphate guanylyltransferase/phosphomannomutase|nr:NTP transferase domain-containing protein [Helicobacteraceae bacterium]